MNKLLQVILITLFFLNYSWSDIAFRQTIGLGEMRNRLRMRTSTSTWRNTVPVIPSGLILPEDDEVNWHTPKLDNRPIRVGVSRIRRMQCDKRIRVLNGATRLRDKGTLARFQCSYGYHMLGSQIAVCVKGKWSDPPPICVRDGCSRLSIPIHGSLRLLYGGAVGAYTCDYGFRMVGEKILTCDGHNWNGTAPQCIEIPPVPITPLPPITTFPPMPEDTGFEEYHHSDADEADLTHIGDENETEDLSQVETTTLSITTTLKIPSSLEPSIATSSESTVIQTAVPEQTSTLVPPITASDKPYWNPPITTSDKPYHNPPITESGTTTIPLQVSKTTPEEPIFTQSITSEEPTSTSIRPSTNPSVFDEPSITEISTITTQISEALTTIRTNENESKDVSQTDSTVEPESKIEQLLPTYPVTETQSISKDQTEKYQITSTEIPTVEQEEKITNAITSSEYEKSTTLMPSSSSTSAMFEKSSTQESNSTIVYDISTTTKLSNVESIYPNSNNWTDESSIAVAPSSSELNAFEFKTHHFYIIGTTILSIAFVGVLVGFMMHCWRKNKGIARPRPNDIDGRTLSFHEGNDELLWLDGENSRL